MELRKDYILDRYVLIATGRKKRPIQFKRESDKDEKECFFCPGKEETTPPEIGRFPKEGPWLLRWFPNKFPAVSLEGDYNIRTDNKFYTFASGYGKHEVLVENPDHNKQMWDLDVENIFQVFKVYKERVNELSKIDGIKYTLIFKNHGREGGTSLVHTHTQIAAIGFLPSDVVDEVNAVKKFENCPYCEIIENEMKSERRCFENRNFVAFAPYGSRFNYEVWIFPKQHKKDLNELNDEEIRDCAEILLKILKKLKEMNISFNFFLHYAPSGEDLHFHIEVTPRIALWAGFEIGSGVIINAVSPEQAAKFYRGEG